MELYSSWSFWWQWSSSSSTTTASALTCPKCFNTAWTITGTLYKTEKPYTNLVWKDNVILILKQAKVYQFNTSVNPIFCPLRLLKIKHEHFQDSTFIETHIIIFFQICLLNKLRTQKKSKKGKKPTCCCLATCSLSFAACFLMASMAEKSRSLFFFYSLLKSVFSLDRERKPNQKRGSWSFWIRERERESRQFWTWILNSFYR